MPDVPRAPFVPPDPRNYLEASPWLAEWCAAQPERKTSDKEKELAGFAGCSATTIHYAIRGDRKLTLANARSLVPHLGLPPEQATHLLGIFEAPHLPPKLARARREQLLATMAELQGVPWGSTHALVSEIPADAAVIAALAPAWAALETPRRSLTVLLSAAVPPIRTAQLEAATHLPPFWTRAAPRLVTLPSPRESAPAALAHEAYLSFAQEALLRLPSSERDFRCVTASADQQAMDECEAADRDFDQALALLAEDAELRKGELDLVVMRQRFLAAGPFPNGAASAGLRWMEPRVPLPMLDPSAETAQEADPPRSEAEPRPSPIGITWFPTWLKVWRAWATAAGRPCSDADLATATGLSRAAIYDLSTGGNRFLSSHIYAFSKVFGFEKDKAAQGALEGMAMVVAPDSPLHQGRLLQALRVQAIAQGVRVPAAEAHFVASQWYARVIVLLPDIGGFQALAGWICRELKGRVDWRAIQETLTALGVLGVLRRDAQGRTVVVEPAMDFQGPHNAVAQHQMQHGLLSLYRAELDMGDPDLSPHVQVLTLPKMAMPRLHRLLAARDARIHAALVGAQDRHKAGAPLDRILILSRQAFPIFRLPSTRTAGPGAAAPSKPGA